MPEERYQQLKYGCIACRVGSEERLRWEMKDRMPNTTVIFPRKKRIRRLGGAALEEETPLFPGYVFFSTEEDRPDLREFLRKDYVFKLLTNPDGDWMLRDSDRQFVEMLFASGGVIGFSKAFYEGDRIRILDGFLKNYEGSIIRLNKRARTAEVRVQFRGKSVSMWVGYEVLGEGDISCR